MSIKEGELTDSNSYLLLIFGPDGTKPEKFYQIPPEWIPNPENDLAALVESLVDPNLTFELLTPDSQNLPPTNIFSMS